MRGSRDVVFLALGLLGLGYACPARGTEPILRIDPGGHAATINDVFFTPDGRYLVSASDDKTVRVWDVRTGEPVRTILGEIGQGLHGQVYAAALSGDAKYLVTGGWFPGGQRKEAAIRLHDFQQGEIRALLQGHKGIVLSLAFSPNGSYVASGSSDHTVRIWKVYDAPGEVAILKGHTDQVCAVAFSPDGRHLVSGSFDHDLRFWSMGGYRLLQRMQGHTDAVACVAYSPDSRYIVSGSWDGSLKLWDGRNGDFIKDLATHEPAVMSVSFAPDASKVLTGCGRGSYSCSVIAVPSGEKIGSFDGHDNAVLASAISPDGTVAATAGGTGNQIYLWSLDTGDVLREMVGDGSMVWNVGVSLDGEEIAWGNTCERSRPADYGPLEHTFRLKEAAEWDLSLGGPVGDLSRFVRATGATNEISLQTRPGKTGRNAVLQVLQREAVICRIERDETSGYRHKCFTLVGDGQRVISGGGSGRLTAYELPSGRKITEFVGHESDVWAVAVGQDQRLLVSGSADQTIRLWNLGRMQDSPQTHPLVSIFVGREGEWVAWTPEGYYASSLRGDRYIGWHVNRGVDQAAEWYPAERFARQFDRPDIVAAVLETGSGEEGFRLAEEARRSEVVAAPLEVRDEEQEIGVQEETQLTEMVTVEEILPPIVWFVRPSSSRAEANSPDFLVEARARSPNEEMVTGMRLLHNGQALPSAPVALPGREGGLEACLVQAVTLEPGENTLTILAENRHARSNPLMASITYTPQMEAVDIYRPDLYVLVVGVADYVDSTLNLAVADRDARAIADLLARQEGHLYREVKVAALINAGATRRRVLDALDWLLKEATHRDIVVMFLAGHGVNDELGNYYFLGHDADPGALRSSAVRWAEFQDVVMSIPAKMLFLVDTCHSGNITGKRRRGAVEMQAALKELIAAGAGVVVMTAATGREYSQERPEWGHGAFTKALLEGLRGDADYDGNGMVEVKELDLFVAHRVKELTGGEQHPTTEIPGTLPNFPVAATVPH